MNARREFTGLRIRAIRKARGLSQGQLARNAGISASYLNLIESNKRPVAGRLLDRIAAALKIERGELDGEVERQLVENLSEIVADPGTGLASRPPASADALVGRHRDWASAILQLYRAFSEQRQTVAALADRLNRDPFLGDSVHRILTHVTAIRSAAEILDGAADIGAADRARFQSIITADSRNLSEQAAALADFFDSERTRVHSATPTEQVDAFVYESGNHFPAIEEWAEAFARSAGDDVVEAAAVRFGDELRYAAALRRSMSEPAWRFAVARHAASRECGDMISAMVAGHPALGSTPAREVASHALASYAAAALLMPYEPFHAAALEHRYDIDALAMRFRVSYEQAAHRLATLRRPGMEGVRFAFMRSDPSGYIDKRLPLPRLPLPRYGSACPIWPVYSAFQTPGLTSRSFGTLPDDETFLFVARAVDKAPPVSGRARRVLSVMLACHADDAQRLAYGDGLDRRRAEPVGTVCRLCRREACSFRQERPIVEDVELKSAREPPAGGSEAGTALLSRDQTI